MGFIDKIKSIFSSAPTKTADRKKGKIKYVNYKKGFGFIEMDGVDGDVFFHFSEVQDSKFHKGDAVEFSTRMEEKGVAAENIIVVV